MNRKNLTADEIKSFITSLPESISNQDMANIFANVIYCYNAQADVRTIIGETVRVLLAISERDLAEAGLDVNGQKVQLN